MRSESIKQMKGLVKEVASTMSTCCEIALNDKHEEFGTALKRELERCGLVIKYDVDEKGKAEERKNTSRVWVCDKKGVVLAHGISENRPDALKHAIYGHLKEVAIANEEAEKAKEVAILEAKYKKDMARLAELEAKEKK